MKNVFLLPTDKPSRLLFDKEEDRLLPLHYEPVFMEHQDLVENQHIYITSNEEIKKDEFYLGDDNHIYNLCTTVNSNGKKIILTTNEELIEEGIQAIDDEFLEWFVKNPSCEEVDVKPLLSNNGRALFGYKIIIPKEEPDYTALLQPVGTPQETIKESNETTAIRFLEWYRLKRVFFQFHSYHIPNMSDKNWETTVFSGENSYLNANQLFKIFKKES